MCPHADFTTLFSPRLRHLSPIVNTPLRMFRHDFDWKESLSPSCVFTYRLPWENRRPKNVLRRMHKKRTPNDDAQKLNDTTTTDTQKSTKTPFFTRIDTPIRIWFFCTGGLALNPPSYRVFFLLFVWFTVSLCFTLLFFRFCDFWVFSLEGHVTFWILIVDFCSLFLCPPFC